MEIVEDRYGAGSTLITSQLPTDTWHEVIGEPTFADAILDRVVHNRYTSSTFSLHGALSLNVVIDPSVCCRGLPRSAQEVAHAATPKQQVKEPLNSTLGQWQQ